MFLVNGSPILADDLSVLHELKAQLAVNGIQRFATFKVGPKNIQFNCPIHNDGQEKKPSCGILTDNTSKMPAGTVHCFTCSYTASLEKMISNCFGVDDDGQFGIRWLIKNFRAVSIENRKDIILDFDRHPKTAKTIEYVSEKELESYRYYHEYMKTRKLTDDVIEQFDVGYDNRFRLMTAGSTVPKHYKCLTFPVRDITGGTLFIASRSVNTKFFHYPEGVNKPVYGLYELPKDADEIIVCESIINALTCYVYGKPAIALLGLGTQYQYEQLRKLPARKFILALDPDEAGQRATERFKSALGKYKLITQYVIPTGKDINDLSQKEFENLLEIY
jgi:hypothetical protein